MFVPLTDRRLFALILILYLLLGCAYSLTNPILESPDELINYENIRYMVENKKLPILQPGEFSKAHHPPLYYLIGALAVGWVPNAHLDDLADNVNPFWGYQAYQVSVDNQSQYLRDPVLEAWPYQDAALGIHLMRWLSLLFGAGVVTAVYLTTRELIRKEPVLAWAAAALVAFNPMFLYIQASVHNDALTNLLAALTILGVVRYWQRGPSLKRVAFIGLVAGLGVLTKITFLFLGPMVLAALVLRSGAGRKHNPGWGWEMVKMVAVGGGIVVLLAGWWFVRNQLLYGEPTSMELQASIWQPRENAPDWGAAVADLAYLRDSFWGVFGWGQIVFPQPVYTLMGLLTLVALMGLVLWAGRYRRRGPEYRVPGLLTAVLLIAPFSAFAATFSRMAVSASADFGRYLFTAYAVIAPLYVLGMTEWFPRSRRRMVMGGLSVLMLALAFYAYGFILKPAYAPPKTLQSADEVEIEVPLAIEYEGEARLLGYSLEPESALPGEELAVALVWEVTGGFAANHALFVQLVAPNGERVAGRDTHGGLGRYPTSLWSPGEIVVDTIPLSVPTVNSGPTGLILTLGLWEADGRLHTTSTGTDTNTLGVVRLAGTASQPVPPVLAQLGDVVALVGIAAAAETAVPGQTIPLTLTWQTLRQPDADYVVFMHLLDADGNLVQTYDHPPQNGVFPTHLWQPGDVVTDEWQIALPAHLADGRYQLAAGWYRLDDLTRLPVTDPQGNVIPDGAIPLLSFSVTGG